jgi:hypothetical protein
LAFSRKRIIEPRVLNPNDLIANFQKMLVRLIGEDVVAHHGVLEPGLPFIGKRYTPQSLARKVREVLDGKG